MRLIAANLLILIHLFLFSCSEDQIECTRVTGGIEEKTISVTGFSKIFFKDVGNLHITQGQEYHFRAEGQKVVLDALETTVDGQELIINLSKCFNGDAYKLDIYITLPEIDEIEMAGVGNVSSENQIISEDLNLILSGITESFSINIKVDSLTTFLSGDGNFSLSGTCRANAITLSGTGDIEAYNLSCDDSSVKVNGIGNCYVNVSNMLNAQINSSGNIYYIGTPDVNTTGNGSGNVINAN